MTTAKPLPTKARSIIPILCGLLISWLCLYMVQESLSVFFPPPKPDVSALPAESQWVVEATRAIAEKYPNHEQKGRIGATFFLVLGGFGLVFFGGGTLLVIYRIWISSPASTPK